MRAQAQAQAPEAHQPEAHQPEVKSFQLTEKELEEIRQLRSKYEPRPKAAELEAGKDPFSEEQS